MIKKIIRIAAVEAIALYLTTQVVEGIYFKDGLRSFLWTVCALSIATYLVKPIINLLILPLNLITFGVFKWASSVLALYLVTIAVNDFQIEKFFFSGFSSYGINLPRLELYGFSATLAYSFFLSILTSILKWVLK